LSKYVR